MLRRMLARVAREECGAHPTLPAFLQTMLANCPRAGGGVHAWLYNTARQLHAHIADKRELADLLEAYAGNCGRIIPRREIEAAVKDSEATAWRPQGSGQATPTRGQANMAESEPRATRGRLA